ncbi:hypothetical protein NZK35_08280 [Stieleria sp. ICT_E10.1]|uniref:hypothetical protein n=1 Tax=Stieleria sedimenti TaxID=2976331 RepID=UPI00217F785C|nr:hypothetical protein [Stieleria sedimenti]MCS7466638.1 hypothetical protein [Stieleria sedimenti]
MTPTVVFSAQVELRLRAGDRNYELGQLGPDFALLRKASPLQAGEAEIESIIDGKSTRRRIRITKSISGDCRRFAFESSN